MRKVLFSCFTICFVFYTWGQQNADANTLFDNFEYERAARAFEANSGKLNQESKEKLAYCYFQTNNFEKGLPLTQQLLQKDSTSGHFWFWRANLEKEKGAFENAAQSFRKVRQYDKTYAVDNLIASCDAIPTWVALPHSEAKLLSNNDSWANNYTLLNGEFYTYFENGKDSASNELSISSESNTFTELFLMKAFASDGTSPLFVDPTLSTYSLSSISRKTNEGKLYFSANDPIAQDNLSHIYTGNLDENGQISKTEMFRGLIGLYDSSALAHPAVTTDGKTMIFTRMGLTTNGSDLYISRLTDTLWSTPKALVFLNTMKDEMFPKITGDSILTFSSDGRIGYGDLDIYSIPLSEIESGITPQHLKAPINSSGDDFNLEWNSDTTAYFVSNRKGGLGDDDVYQLLVKKETPPAIEPIVEINTAFQNWLTKWNNHKMYFDFDKSESESAPEFLIGMLAYAKSHELGLKITGHTDAKGSDVYNQKLGQERAEWFKSKLIKAGIDAERITVRSVGENELVNDCGNFSNCTEEAYRLNRFIQISIVSNASTTNSTQATL